MDQAVLVLAGAMGVLLVMAIASLVLLVGAQAEEKSLALFDPVPVGSGAQVSPRELTVRELTKPRTDPQYRAKVSADLARTKTDPEVRRERIRRFVSGGDKPIA